MCYILIAPLLGAVIGKNPGPPEPRQLILAVVKRPSGWQAQESTLCYQNHCNPIPKGAGVTTIDGTNDLLYRHCWAEVVGELSGEVLGQQFCGGGGGGHHRRRCQVG